MQGTKGQKNHIFGTSFHVRYFMFSGSVSEEKDSLNNIIARISFPKNKSVWSKLWDRT